MKWWLLCACLVVASLVLWLIRGRRAAQSNASAQSAGQSYHSVTIRHPNDACVAVRGVAGRKFLAREAPLFPLGNCEAATCRCRYVHYDDRRDDERRSPFAVRHVLLTGSEQRERRVAPDRRHVRASGVRRTLR